MSSLSFAALEKLWNDAAIVTAGVLGLPYQVENRKIDPPADQKYLRFTNFRNTTISPHWTAEGSYIQGIFQIDIVYPADIGTYAIIVIADTIVGLYDQGTILSMSGARIVVSAKPSVLSAVTNGHETFIPVSIPYRCFEQ